MNDELSTIVVVSELSVAQLACMLECPEGSEFEFCTTTESASGVLTMLRMIPVREVLVVGVLFHNGIAAVASYAKENGLPIRTWKKETMH